MKKIFTLSVFILGSIYGWGQDLPQFKINALNKYYDEIDKKYELTNIPDTLDIEIPNNPQLNNDLDDAVILNRNSGKYNIISEDKNSNTNTKNDEMLLTDLALNIYFASEISAYVTDSKDLTLQKAYAVLNTSDKTLFLGGSFQNRNDNTMALHWLYTVGIKSKVEDDFATIYKDGELQNDLGLNLKVNYIGNGSIFYIQGHEERLSSYRDEMVTRLISETVYDNNYGISDTEKERDFFEKIAKEEVNYLRKFKLYNLSTNHWFSLETYIPVSPKQYETLKNITITDIETENFYPWQVTAGFTKYWKYSTGKSYYLSVFGDLKNNNNIEVEDLNKYTYPVFDNENSELIEVNKTVYGGVFEQFITPSLNVESVNFIFLEGIFGVSGSVEKTFGKYDMVNWKLGMPVTLKDKENKPSVNFELVWKQVNKEHFVGVNVGFTFGKTIQ